MSTNRSLAIGIDLGTTFSVIARLDDVGRPVTVPNAEGDLTTPSVILFDAGDVVVGKEAVKALFTDAERVAECPKREIGASLFSKVVDGQQFAPEVLEAYILKRLVDDARRQLGDFDQAVITVPAYFDDVRRKATQDAGYMAGIEVLDIVNEPQAAAVAFGYQEGFLTPEGRSEVPRNILVYDLGGGTFDITLMRIEGKDFITLAVDGDVQLGGRDWDERLVNTIAEQFMKENGLDPREHASAAGRLWRDCEEAKRTLSSRKKAIINCDYRGRSLQREITRDEFRSLTLDLLDRTKFTTRQALQAAGLSWDQIDRVLLVGGSTRMPMVIDMLKELTGRDPDHSVSADEAVAHGAALRAGLAIAENAGRPPNFNLRNVNSHSLGVVGTDPQTLRKRNVIMIPRNAPLPVEARKIFRTQRAGQKGILVEIVEGESMLPEACTPIGQCAVRDLPQSLPAGAPIEVRFRYGADGRLGVGVKVADTEIELQHEITRETGLSQAELDAWRAKIMATPVG